MTNSPLSLRLLLIVYAAAASAALAQNAPPAMPPTVANRPMRPVNPGMVQNQGTEPAKPLSSNYRVSFTGKTGDKVLGELSTLTCSPRIAVAGPLDASEVPTSFEVSGTIEEREGGQIVFDYQIMFSVPVPSQTMSAKDKPVMTTYNYQRHTCTGSLLMKAGKSYDILKAGGATHSVTITPEAEK